MIVRIWQIKAGNSITITEPSMPRFVTSLEDVVELVIFAFQNAKSGEISEYVKRMLVDMSKKVIENIAMKYANVKKGVTSIMGGKILEYEAKTIREFYRSHSFAVCVEPSSNEIQVKITKE